ncbi:MAG: hypothetical protein EON93_14205 [Burkholderiales bacterium]|nr:MAG: hypothetical protein EON93_14205 [Burkholderiales bacterium]
MQTVGVIGAGQMGAGIAQTFAQHGMKVLLSDVNLAAAERGKAGIDKALGRLVGRRIGIGEQDRHVGFLRAIFARLQHVLDDFVILLGSGGAATQRVIERGAIDLGGIGRRARVAHQDIHRLELAVLIVAAQLHLKAQERSVIFFVVILGDGFSGQQIGVGGCPVLGLHCCFCGCGGLAEFVAHLELRGSLSSSLVVLLLLLGHCGRRTERGGAKRKHSGHRELGNERHVELSSRGNAYGFESPLNRRIAPYKRISVPLPHRG